MVAFARALGLVASSQSSISAQAVTAMDSSGPAQTARASFSPRTAPLIASGCLSSGRASEAAGHKAAGFKTRAQVALTNTATIGYAGSQSFGSPISNNVTSCLSKTGPFGKVARQKRAGCDRIRSTTGTPHGVFDPAAWGCQKYCRVRVLQELDCFPIGRIENHAACLSDRLTASCVRLRRNVSISLSPVTPRV